MQNLGGHAYLRDTWATRQFGPDSQARELRHGRAAATNKLTPIALSDHNGP